MKIEYLNSPNAGNSEATTFVSMDSASLSGPELVVNAINYRMPQSTIQKPCSLAGNCPTKPMEYQNKQSNCNCGK